MNVIKPESREHWLELRKDVISSTEVAGLFGLSEWATSFSLWQEKREGRESEMKETERTEWGKKLEAVVAQAVGEKYGVAVFPYDHYHKSDSMRIGASFDFCMDFLDPERGTKPEQVFIECKCVDGLIFKEKFIAEGDQLLELPLQYEFQIQTQLLLSKASLVVVGVLVNGNKLYTLIRRPDKKVQEAIVKKVREFWEATEAPIPDWEKDSELLNKIYSKVDGETVGADEKLDDLMSAYSLLSEMESNAAKGKAAVKAEILSKIHSASKVMGDRFKISRSWIKPAEIAFTRDGYSTFRITKVKQK